LASQLTGWEIKRHAVLKILMQTRLKENAKVCGACSPLGLDIDEDVLPVYSC